MAYLAEYNACVLMPIPQFSVILPIRSGRNATQAYPNLQINIVPFFSSLCVNISGMSRELLALALKEVGCRVLAMSSS